MDKAIRPVFHKHSVDNVGPEGPTRPRDARDARPRAIENLLPTTTGPFSEVGLELRR